MHHSLPSVTDVMTFLVSIDCLHKSVMTFHVSTSSHTHVMTFPGDGMVFSGMHVMMFLVLVSSDIHVMTFRMLVSSGIHKMKFLILVSSDINIMNFMLMI